MTTTHDSLCIYTEFDSPPGVELCPTCKILRAARAQARREALKEAANTAWITPMLGSEVRRVASIVDAIRALIKPVPEAQKGPKP